MKVKGFYKFIKEDADSDKYEEVTSEIKTMIETTIENSGGEYSDFIEKFIKEPEEVKIEGLINDTDIYDFYLKYRNQIDELLNDVKYFGYVPEELNVFGLYDYIIAGTKKSIEEFVKILSQK